MSKRVILTKGLPACGKTTWCKEQIDKQPGRYKRISKDDLRAMMDNGKWSKGNEQFILKVRDTLILTALQEGYHVLVDDTNLHSKHQHAISELVKGKAVVEIKDFTDVPLETCLERDKKRANYVGEDTIRKMHRDFLKPAHAQPPAYDWSLPDAIIADLDGTLALMNGRNPYDASTCEEDLLNEPIADIVKWQYSEAETVLLVSGRSEKHREPTERWLKKHSIRYHHLFMRKDDDNRRDYIIKQEIYSREIAGKYNILFVLDDRKKVVEVWRSYGLICLQVAEGDY